MAWRPGPGGIPLLDGPALPAAVVREKEWLERTAQSPDLDPLKLLQHVQQSKAVTVAAMDEVLAHEAVVPLLRGHVLDAGAGVGWLAARLARLPAVSRASLLDVSELYFDRVTLPVLRHLGVDVAKVRFLVSDFDHVPASAEPFDCVFLVAALHHSPHPPTTVRHLAAQLNPGGVIIAIEHPASRRRRERARADAEACSAELGVNEHAYTRAEFDAFLRTADVGPVSRYALTTGCSPGARMLARRLLRAVDWEHLVSAPVYCWVVRPAPS